MVAFNKARPELLIASVCPLVSFGLLVISRLTFEILPTDNNAVATVIVYLALINFLLG